MIVYFSICYCTSQQFNEKLRRGFRGIFEYSKSLAGILTSDKVKYYLNFSRGNSCVSEMPLRIICDASLLSSF